MALLSISGLLALDTGTSHGLSRWRKNGGLAGPPKPLAVKKWAHVGSPVAAQRLRTNGVGRTDLEGIPVEDQPLADPAEPGVGGRDMEEVLLLTDAAHDLIHCGQDPVTGGYPGVVKDPEGRDRGLKIRDQEVGPVRIIHAPGPALGQVNGDRPGKAQGCANDLPDVVSLPAGAPCCATPEASLGHAWKRVMHPSDPRRIANIPFACDKVLPSALDSAYPEDHGLGDLNIPSLSHSGIGNTLRVA